MKPLKEKVMQVGAWYIAQQVETGLEEVSDDPYFTPNELTELDVLGIDYIEDILVQEYEPFDDLTDKEVQAIKEGLKDYEIYGLVDDWGAGINDFDYDKVMIDYLKDKEGNRHEVYNRLYVTILNIKVEDNHV